MENNLPSTTYVGRQAIYDQGLDVFAYELLYRDSEENRASIGDQNQATAELLSNVFTSIGLDELVNGKPAFVNMPTDFLLGSYPIPQSKCNLVIEILEHVPPEPRVISALRNLKARGYTLALDDYVFDEHLEPFLELADIVKVDIMALEAGRLTRKMSELKTYGTRLLAEKVETEQDIRLCRELGFDYLQGYYFSTPQIVKGRKMDGSQVTLMQILQKVSNPDVTTEELADAVQRDVSVSYKLLRYVNSAMFSFPREIESIKEAVVMLGRDTLIRLVHMITVSSFADRPDLCQATLQRGRMCEQLSHKLGQGQLASTYFMAGMFSRLDALIGVPLEELIEHLPLAGFIKDALLRHEGVLGELLRLVYAYERGNHADLVSQGIGVRTLVEAYLEAVTWADQAMNNLQ